MKTKLERFWARLWSWCWFRHVGHRIRVHRDGQLFFECGECGLEIHQALPAQVPRIDYALQGREKVKPITTSANVIGFRRNK